MVATRSVLTLVALQFFIHKGLSILASNPAISFALPLSDVTEGTASLTLTVMTDMAVTGDLTVTLTVDTNTANTQASPGFDFGGTGTYSVTIADRTTSGDLTLAIADDDLLEPNEVVTIEITTFSGGDGSETLSTTPTDVTSSFTIMDDGDTNLVQVNFADSIYEVDEGGGPVNVQLSFTDSTGQPTVLNGAESASPTLPRVVSLDTASPGTDYTDPTGTSVTFTYDLMATSVTFPVTIAGSDTVAEPTEVFYVSLGTFTDGTYAELGTLRSETSIRIRDVDTESLICVAARSEVFRSSSANFVFYAFTSFISGQTSIDWNKSDLPSSFATFVNEGSYGKSLTVGEPNKINKRRFGAYTFTATDSGGATLTCKSYIKAKSNVLNYPDSMAQKYTLIIYPSTDGGTTLTPAVNFGVSYNDPRRRNTLVWRKDGTRLQNSQSTLRITDTSSAGVYMISRSTRGKRGWFAVIDVIASECPTGIHRNCAPSCSNPCENCYNGGVCDAMDGKCLCPPCFEGKHCELVATTVGTFGMTNRFSCSSDLGADSTCQGVLFSYERNYGSTCGCGWSGTDCLTPCTVGTFGADCTQTCHCMTPDSCDIRTGECTDGLGCETGYTGDNCQILG